MKQKTSLYITLFCTILEYSYGTEGFTLSRSELFLLLLTSPLLIRRLIQDQYSGALSAIITQSEVGITPLLDLGAII